MLSIENLEMIIVQHIRMEADSVRSEELCTVYFIHKKKRESIEESKKIEFYLLSLNSDKIIRNKAWARSFRINFTTQNFNLLVRTSTISF